jgi:hypothetical protein
VTSAPLRELVDMPGTLTEVGLTETLPPPGTRMRVGEAVGTGVGAKVGAADGMNVGGGVAGSFTEPTYKYILSYI